MVIFPFKTTSYQQALAALPKDRVEEFKRIVRNRLMLIEQLNHLLDSKADHRLVAETVKLLKANGERLLIRAAYYKAGYLSQWALELRDAILASDKQAAQAAKIDYASTDGLAGLMLLVRDTHRALPPLAHSTGTPVFVLLPQQQGQSCIVLAPCNPTLPAIVGNRIVPIDHAADALTGSDLTLEGWQFLKSSFTVPPQTDKAITDYLSGSVASVPINPEFEENNDSTTGLAIEEELLEKEKTHAAGTDALALDRGDVTRLFNIVEESVSVAAARR